MKGGKNEKITGPMFPRLHVNDTEKGGPRAPPRNKMALYEQLCIPSQRTNSGSTSTLPLPPNNASSLVPSASSSQGVEHEKPVFSPIYIPSPTPAHLSENLHSLSSDGVNFNTSTVGFEQRHMKDYQTLNAAEHLSSTAECNSFRPHDFSNSKDSCGKRLGDEDDFRVPAFVHSGMDPCSSKSPHNVDRERSIPFSPSHPSRSTVISENSMLKTAAITCNSSMPLRNARDKHLKRTNTTDLTARQHGRNQYKEHWKEPATSKGSAQKPASHPLIREKSAEHLKSNYAYSHLDHQSSPVDDFERVRDSGAQFHPAYISGLLLENTACSNGISAESLGAMGKGTIAIIRGESCSRASVGNGHKSPKEAEKCSEYHEESVHRSLQVGDLDRNDDASETSIVDSLMGLDISPDDVVGVIGQKHFWKARRAITNQQRVFAVQVFELHRLIKVQRLIAGSPHLLLEDNPYFRKPPLKVSPAKKLPSEYVLKSLPPIIKQKDNSQKPNQSSECATENDVHKPSHPSFNDDINKGLVSQHPSYGPYSGNPPATPVTENNAGPWDFYPPQGNQWLLPIMSPSEGLVYKPYTAPFPPNAGFMAPVYGGCGPVNLPPMAGGFLNPAYGATPSYPQGVGSHSGSTVAQMYFPQTYFPPYGMPIMNSGNSGSASEVMRPPGAGAQPHMRAEQLSAGEVNCSVDSQYPGNLLNQKSEAVSCCALKYQTSKDSELQGSTASSPCEKAQVVAAVQVSEGRGASSLFPMAPDVGVSSSDQPPHSQSSKQKTLVIRVVPHNPGSATESAARIFRSIQKERQQCDPS